MHAGTGARKLLSSDQTWIVNDCSVDLKATIKYANFSNCDAKSKFVNRVIKAGDKDHDQYCQQSHAASSTMWVEPAAHGGAGGTLLTGGSPHIVIVLKVASAKNVGTFAIQTDDSVVVKNAAKGGGYDVFKVKHGHLHVTDGAALGQIFSN